MEMNEQDKQEMMSHIREHAQYPATKQALVEACNNMEHVSEEHRKWFSDTLPDKTYQNADEVISAVSL